MGRMAASDLSVPNMTLKTRVIETEKDMEHA